MHYYLELDLVHKNGKAKIAVAGVFIKIGKFNKSLQKLFDDFHAEINKLVLEQN